MKKRVLSIFLSVLTVILSIPSFAFTASAADYASELISKGFPASYVPQLIALHEKYPNWNFEVLDTKESFDYAVSQERTEHKQQLIQKYSGNDGKGYYCTCSYCKDKVYEGGGWVAASQSVVEYYMDPRNFLDEKYIFQFESIFRNESQTQAGVEGILSGTWMHNANITYKDASGNTHTYSPTKKYSAAIMEASKASGLSAYYIAAKIVQEVGGATNSAGGASGTYSGYPGIYNYYNIAAYTGAADGLKWAADNSGGPKVQTSSGIAVNLRSGPSTSHSIITSVPSGTKVSSYSYTAKQSDGYRWVNITATISGKSYTGYIREDYFYAAKDKYNRPWTNPYLSITNGAQWIMDNFEDQFTGYLQKFNVNPNSDSRHSHEYMANVQGAALEGLKKYNGYSKAGNLSDARTFSIPVYNNMPGNAPLSVTNIKVTSISATGARITFSDPSNADGYEISYLENGKWIYTSSDTTSIELKNLKPDTEYGLSIRSYYDLGSVKSYSAWTSAWTTTDKFRTYMPSVANIKATEITATSAKITFDAVEGATRYEISYTDNPDNSSSWIYVSSNTNSVVLKNLKENTAYGLSLRAHNAAGNCSVWTLNARTTDRFTTSSSAFTAPIADFTLNTNSTFTITWNKVAGADEYEVYYSSDGGKTYKLKTTTTATSVKSGQIAYGGGFRYKVRAVDKSNNIKSAYSNIVNAVNDKYLPAPTAKCTVNTDCTLTISWNKVTGADKYEIYFSNDNGKTYKYVTATDSTSLKSGKAPYGINYKYKIRAVNSENDIKSEYCTVNAVNNKYLVAPTVTYTVNTNRTLTISWNKVTGAEQYEVYYSSDGGKTYNLKTTTTATSTKSGQVAYGYGFRYKVRAINSSKGLTSAYSNVVNAVNNKYLAAPTVKYTVNSDCTFTITWNKITGADKYEIYFSNDNGKTYKYVTATESTSLKSGKAPYGINYKYKIRAVNSENNIKSEYCTINTVNNQKLVAPSASLKVNTDGTFTISWNKVTGATEYEIYMYDSATQQYKLSRTLTGTSVTTTKGAVGVTYKYKVRAITSENASAASDFSAVVTGKR